MVLLRGALEAIQMSSSRSKSVPSTSGDVYPRYKLWVGAFGLVSLIVLIDLFSQTTRAGIARLRNTGLVSAVVDVVWNFDELITHSLPAFMNHAFAYGAYPAAPYLTLAIAANLFVLLFLCVFVRMLLKSLVKIVPGAAVGKNSSVEMIILIIILIPVIVYGYTIFKKEIVIGMDLGVRWGLLLPAILVPNVALVTILYLRDRGLVRRFFAVWCFRAALLPLGLLIVSWVSFTLHPTTTAAVGPNILLISIDSLRSDHLSCYGYGKETSPTIDRLADTGALFETVVSPTSWTLPAHHTLLTGLAPEQHGVIYPTQRLDTDVTTLAEVLRDAGYFTFGVVSGIYLDASYGFHQGFEVYDDFSSLYRADIGRVVTSPSFSRATEGWLHHWDREERGRPFLLSYTCGTCITTTILPRRTTRCSIRTTAVT